MFADVRCGRERRFGVSGGRDPGARPEMRIT